MSKSPRTPNLRKTGPRKVRPGKTLPPADNSAAAPLLDEDSKYDLDKESQEFASRETDWDDNNAGVGQLDPAFIDEFGRPNKSALKRHATELQVLGEALIALPQLEFDELPLPENLRDAVTLARRITQHGGLYRQKQYIGKLMRKIDAEPIRAAIQARQEGQRASARQFQRIERWRNRLIDDPTSIDEFASLYTHSDRKKLTRLIDQARHERQRSNAGAARELFGYVKEVFADDPAQFAPEPK
jgi:ribosome-associated protein